MADPASRSEIINTIYENEDVRKLVDQTQNDVFKVFKQKKQNKTVTKKCSDKSNYPSKSKSKSVNENLNQLSNTPTHKESIVNPITEIAIREKRRNILSTKTI